MKSMYHDSSEIKSAPESVVATARLLLIMDMFALRAVALDMAADMAYRDPFSAQAENAWICARRMCESCSSLEAFAVADDDGLDLFAETESVRPPAWRCWCADMPDESCRKYERFAVLESELVRLADALDAAGLSDMGRGARVAAEYAHEVHA